AQPRQRLQLRRGLGAVRRAERAAQEVVPERVFLPHHPGAPARRAGRLGRRPGAAAVRPSRHLLPGLPRDPLPGDDAGVETHYVPLAGKAQPSVLSFFALDQESRALCYANANLTRGEQPAEVMRFVEFWHELTNADPSWLYFDSKVTAYPELDRLN